MEILFKHMGYRFVRLEPEDWEISREFSVRFLEESGDKQGADSERHNDAMQYATQIVDDAVICALNGNNPIAFSCIITVHDPPVIGLHVLEEHRGKRIASSLYYAAAKYLAENTRHDHIQAGIDAQNHPSIKSAWRAGLKPLKSEKDKTVLTLQATTEAILNSCRIDLPPVPC